MKREQFTDKLHAQMDSVHASSALKSRTLCAMLGKEQTPYMKKKISLAAVFALLAVALCAAALAAASRLGMLDFSKAYSRVYVPEDTETYVEPTSIALENEWVSAHIRETYYDGRTCRVIVDVTAKQENTLLSGVPVDMTMPAYMATGDENIEDKHTVYEKLTQRGYSHLIALNSWIQDTENTAVGHWRDYRTGEDGVMTMLVQESFTENLPTRDVRFNLRAVPYEMPLTPESKTDEEKRDTATVFFTLTAAVPSGASIINVQPVEFPTAGVRVDKVLVEEKPQELFVTLEYTVVNNAAFRQYGYLCFEFIDENIETKRPRGQQLRSGMNYSAYQMRIEAKPQKRYQQTLTLAKNELRDVYTLRAYDHLDISLYTPACQVPMRPATADDLAN